jgi:CRP/FNR family cyclic AMP-dependent transcriptional regulator
VEYSRDQIFYRLPETLCELLYAAGDVARAPGGTLIIAEGDKLDRLFILLSGQIEVFLPRNDRRLSEVVLTRLSPGDCFGEYAFADQHPASASVRTLEECDVYSIPHTTLREFLDSHHAVASVIYQNLLRILVRRLRASNAELDLFTPSL